MDKINNIIFFVDDLPESLIPMDAMDTNTSYLLVSYIHQLLKNYKVNIYHRIL